MLGTLVSYATAYLGITETIETVETKQAGVYVSPKLIETSTVSIHHCFILLKLKYQGSTGCRNYY